MNENSQKGKKRKPRTPRQHIDPEGLDRQPQFEHPLGKILARLKIPFPVQIVGINRRVNIFHNTRHVVPPTAITTKAFR